MFLNRKGFTLFELMIVIGLIILLTVGGLYGYRSFTRSQKEKIVKANLSIILETLDRYREKTGDYPADQDAFDDFLEDKRWFKDVPKNPFWNSTSSSTRYGWLYIRNENGSEVEVEVYALGSEQ